MPVNSSYGECRLQQIEVSQVGWANGSIVNTTLPHEGVGLRKDATQVYAIALRLMDLVGQNKTCYHALRLGGLITV